MPKSDTGKSSKKSENQYFPQPLAGFLWCMSGKNHENPLGTRQKNIAPLPRSSSLLTLPQGSLATTYHDCGDPMRNPRDQVKIFFFELEILKIFRFRKFWNSKKFRRKKSSSKNLKISRFFWPKYFQTYFAGGGLVFSDFGLGQRPLRIELLISGNFGCFVSTFQACSETRPRLALPRGLI